MQCSIFVFCTKCGAYQSDKKSRKFDAECRKPNSSARDRMNRLLGLEASVVYQITDKLELEANFIKYEDKDFSLKFSIWGPLKRMLYIN